MANPTFWNTYRWEFELDNNGFRRFRQCAARLQMLGEEDPEKDLLSQNKREWTRTRQLESEWKVPDLSRLDFASRALVEGLIGHGIVRPIDVANLLNALDEFAKALPFRQRLLTNLFAEERIRNVHTVVQGESAIEHRRLKRSACCFASSRRVPGLAASRDDTHCHSHSYQGAGRPAFTGDE